MFADIGNVKRYMCNVIFLSSSEEIVSIHDQCKKKELIRLLLLCRGYLENNHRFDSRRGCLFLISSLIRLDFATLWKP